MSSWNTTYSLEVEEPHDAKRTGVMRSPLYPNELISTTVDNGITNCWSLFQLGCKKSYKKACIGQRKRGSNGVLSKYEWLTYEEVEDKALRFGSALLDLNLVTDTCNPDEDYPPAQRMKFVSICSTNRVEWFIAEQAANAFGFTILPLYDTFGLDAVKSIDKETNITFVCCSMTSLPFMLQVAEHCPHLTSLVVFDDVPPDMAETIKSKSITLYSFSTLVAWENKRSPSPCPPEHISTLCYTSGSTGRPKGALLTHSNFVACVSGVLRGIIETPDGISVTSSDIHFSYLPLAHVFERTICNVIFALGASIGVYSSDIAILLEDVQELKPTIFISVPRIFSRIDSKIQQGVKSKSSFAQYLFGTAMESKLSTLHSNANPRHRFWDPVVFRKTRRLMGGNIRYMLVGGAPIESTVEDRIKIYFGAPLLEGYGLTESLGCSFIASSKDPVSGHVGGPVPCIEFCLESVEEMQYDVNGPHCRGEILLRGPSIFKGYFKNKAETKMSFDEDGWFRTGDIGMILPNGGLKIIDRRKNIFKLAQGEYVVPEKIESIYSLAPLVSQIFIYGHSSQTYLVAIVVPDPGAAQQWKEDHDMHTVSLEDLCLFPQFAEDVKNELENSAAMRNLAGFEKVKNFHLHPEAFSVENGMLTPTFKFKRKVIEQHFKTIFQNLYNEKLFSA